MLKKKLRSLKEQKIIISPRSKTFKCVWNLGKMLHTYMCKYVMISTTLMLFTAVKDVF